MRIRPSKAEREEYQTDYSNDTAYSSYARLLQSKWRESKGIPFNQNKYGNFIRPDYALEEKANFLTSNTKLLAEYEVLRKGNFNKLIEEKRFWENMLSSQPLCFNLFGELHFDHKLATKFFQKLFPRKITNVTEILFEHSPGRGNEAFTGDLSAFDVFVEYSNDSKKGFIGIEVKYAESLREESESKATATFGKHRENYLRLTSQSYFKKDIVPIISKPPLSQIWRDHLLSIATKQIYDEGFFVFLFPSLNTQCQQGVDKYQELLVGENEDETVTGFYPRHLELFIQTLVDIHPCEWTFDLKRRYLGSES